MKKKQVKHIFFQFVGLGNLKISGRFRATPTWSSWHSLPGRKLQEPRSTRKINRSSESSEFLQSSFRVPSESRSTRSIPRELHKSHRASHRFLQFFPGQGTFAVLVILLQIVNHYLRRTVPVSLSLVKGCKRHGHMKLGPVLSSSDWPELSRNALSIHPAWCRGAAVCNKKI
jgi:hypothetical protein